MNKFYVILPGLQMLIETESSFDDLFKSLAVDAKNGCLILNPKDGIRSLYLVSSNQHFQLNLMTEQEYNRMQAEQRYAAAQQQPSPIIQGRH